MFRLITLEPDDTDEWKWHQCVCLIAPNRMICNMTQFDLTWPWPQVKFSNWPFGVKMGIIRIVLTRETQRRQNHRPRPNRSEVMNEKRKLKNLVFEFGKHWPLEVKPLTWGQIWQHIAIDNFIAHLFFFCRSILSVIVWVPDAFN